MDENRSVEIIQEDKNLPTGIKNDEELKPESDIKRSDAMFLYIAVLTVQLLSIVIGSHMVWTSPALIQLKSNDTDINPLGRPITTVDISLILGVPSLISLIGPLILSKLSDYIGRKKFLQLMAFSIFLSGSGLAFSTTIISIILSRCIILVIFSGIWIVVIIYISEICEDHNRTKFSCLIGLFDQFGNLFIFIIGPIFSIRTFTFITTAPALIFLIFSFLVPESPLYLLSKCKTEECKKSLQFLRKNKTEKELQQDFSKIEKAIKEIPKAKNILSLFNKRVNRFALLLAIFPVIIQVFSGLDVLMPFLALFFNSAGTNISGNDAAILVSIVKLSCYAFTSFVVEKFGRRRMLLISTIGTGLPFITLGIYFYLKHINSYVLSYIQWLPLTSLLSIVVIYSVGLGIIPATLMCELFPSDLRAAATSFILTVITTLSSILSVSYPLVSEAIGVHWCMWMFSIFCFIGAVLIYLYLPDTEGKDFMQIQEMLKKY